MSGYAHLDWHSFFNPSAIYGFLDCGAGAEAGDFAGPCCTGCCTGGAGAFPVGVFGCGALDCGALCGLAGVTGAAGLFAGFENFSSTEPPPCSTALSVC